MNLHLMRPNLHVVLVHFPMALLVMGLIIELLSLIWRQTGFRTAGRWMILLGTIAAVPTALTGLFALHQAEVGSLDHSGDAAALITPLNSQSDELLEDHWMQMTIATAASLVIVVAWIGCSDLWRRRLYPLFLLAFMGTVGIFLLGAWHGGEAVYGHGVGVSVAGETSPGDADHPSPATAPIKPTTLPADLGEKASAVGAKIDDAYDGTVNLPRPNLPPPIEPAKPTAEPIKPAIEPAKPPIESVKPPVTAALPVEPVAPKVDPVVPKPTPAVEVPSIPPVDPRPPVEPIPVPPKPEPIPIPTPDPQPIPAPEPVPTPEPVPVPVPRPDPEPIPVPPVTPPATLPSTMPATLPSAIGLGDGQSSFAKATQDESSFAPSSPKLKATQTRASARSLVEDLMFARSMRLSPVMLIAEIESSGEASSPAATEAATESTGHVDADDEDDEASEGEAFLPPAGATTEQKLAFYAPPLQIHLIVAGLTIALSLISLGLSIRVAVNAAARDRAENAQRELSGEDDALSADEASGDSGVIPAGLTEPITLPPAPVPASRFWLLAALLALVTMGLGWYTLAHDFELFSSGQTFGQISQTLWDTVRSRDVNEGRFLTRRMGHVIAGGAIFVLPLVLAILARVAPRKKILLAIFALLVILSIAAQAWLGLLLLTGGAEGPITKMM